MTDEAPAKKTGNFARAKEGWLKLCASYPNLSGADLGVVIVLSTYLNSKTGYAWPSIETLAKVLNRNRSTVSRSIKRLEELGLLTIIHGRGRKKSNRYRPNLGRLEVDPITLRRKTLPRGKMLRSRNVNTANSHKKACEFAARTSEEEQKNLGAVEFEGRTISRRVLPVPPTQLRRTET